MGKIITTNGVEVDARLIDIILYPIEKEELFSILTSLTVNKPNKHYYALAEFISDLDKDNPAYPIIEALNNYGCKYVK